MPSAVSLQVTVSARRKSPVVKRWTCERIMAELEYSLGEMWDIKA